MGISVIVVEIVACSPSARDGEALSVRDSAGIEFVYNRPRLLGEADDSAVPDLILGKKVAFADPVDVQFGPDGDVLVLDRGLSQIFVFTSEGQQLRALGEAGSGPGELSKGVAQLILRADTAFVPQLMLDRIERWVLSNGQALRPIPLGDSKSLPFQFEIDDAGRIWESRRRLPGPESRSADSAITVGWLDAGGTFRVVARIGGGPRVESTSNGIRVTPYAAQPVWALGAGEQLFIGMGTRYEVRVYNISGGLERVVERAWRANPLSTNEKQVLRDQFTRLLINSHVPQSVITATRNEIGLPKEFPALTALRVDPAGRIWVQTAFRSSEPLERCADLHRLSDLGSSQWDVYAPTGKYLTRVHFPACLHITDIGDDAAVGFTYSSTGVPLVYRVRFHVPNASAPDQNRDHTS